MAGRPGVSAARSTLAKDEAKKGGQKPEVLVSSTAPLDQHQQSEFVAHDVPTAVITVGGLAVLGSVLVIVFVFTDTIEYWGLGIAGERLIG